MIAYQSKNQATSGSVGQTATPGVATPSGTTLGDLLLWVIASQEGSYGWGGTIGGADKATFTTLLDVTADPGSGSGLGRSFFWMGMKLATSADLSHTYSASLTGTPLGPSESGSLLMRVNGNKPSGSPLAGTPGTYSSGTSPSVSSLSVPSVTLGSGLVDSGRTIQKNTGNFPQMIAVWAGSILGADASETIVVMEIGMNDGTSFSAGTGTVLQTAYAPGGSGPAGGMWFSSAVVTAPRVPRFRHMFPTD